MHAGPRSEGSSRRPWRLVAAAFLAGLCAGVLVTRLSSVVTTEDDGSHEAPAAGTQGADGAAAAAPRAGTATARAAAAQRARSPSGEPAERAFPSLRWREASSAPPPPPGPDATVTPPADAATWKIPATVEAALQVLAAAARATEEPSEQETASVMSAAVLVANASPRPSVRIEVLRGLAVRFPDTDAGGVVLPCLEAGAEAEELALLLRGEESWGRSPDVWAIRLAARAAETGRLADADLARLLASPNPWVRAAAVNLAAEHGRLDRARLGALVENDGDVGVRIAAFRRFVESTMPGQEAETWALVRRLVWFPDKLGETAVEALPGLGAGAVPIARELVAAGGLDGAEVRYVAATLLQAGEPDALIPLARRGAWNEEILDAIDDRKLEHPEEIAACVPLVRAMPVPRTWSDASDHCQAIANLGMFGVLAQIARSAVASPDAQVAAISMTVQVEERRDEGLVLAVEALSDANADLRRLVLAEFGEELAESSPERKALLRGLVERDPSPSVRRAAAEALDRAN